ncbi:hypothetical protein [Sphingomonas sp. 28-63-12]|uniref:hypothetical protein n=1 Tax=Sphingomonas sp. 28-63-12 TaxID=1970434 RepID=UPI000BD412A3|nr:MAG: hypothetical protein B7Y47_06175 [Sphingomonas sp. 28-63-12]
MRTKLIGIALLAGLSMSSTMATAQTAIDGRVDRLEREMRAVQRKVFPGGNGQYFPPEISPQTGVPATAPGTPATTPVADLNGRVSALEGQLAAMTGQIEQTQHKQQQFEEAFAAYRRSTDARLTALEEGASTPGSAAASGSPGTFGGAPPLGTTPASAKPLPIVKPATLPKPAAATPAPTAADPARARLVAAVERPATDDPADDGYVYGYRLWQAKLYPEAQAQLKQVVAKYPTHRRASWAQNLLGRSYLDEGKPSLASLAFYENYKKFHDGERAPDSLYFLTVALKKLGKPSADICQVYDELLEVYPTKITAEMKADVARGRAQEKCKAN